MPVTLRDIAKRLDLSHATVSFVLNDRRDVAIPESTRQRVFQAAREMGYRPNLAARALVSGRTQILSVCVPQIRSSFYGHIFQTLVEACQAAGYQVLVSPSRAGVFRRAMDWPVDGVFVVDAPDVIRSGDIPEHIPIMSVGTDVLPEKDHVYVDVSAGSADAIRHLAEGGARRIAYIAGPETPERRDLRGEVYRDTMVALGLEPREIRLQGLDGASVVAACRDLGGANRPEAFFCIDDAVAMAMVRGLTDLGLRCPGDYTIVGGDGSEIGALTIPSMSSVAIPVQEMCAKAVELLLLRMKDPKAEPQSVHLPASLVIRESTRSEAPV